MNAETWSEQNKIYKCGDFGEKKHKCGSFFPMRAGDA